MAFPFILCQPLFAADASQYLCWLVLPEGHEGFPGSPQHTVSMNKRRARPSIYAYTSHGWSGLENMTKIPAGLRKIIPIRIFHGGYSELRFFHFLGHEVTQIRQWIGHLWGQDQLCSKMQWPTTAFSPTRVDHWLVLLGQLERKWKKTLVIHLDSTDSNLKMPYTSWSSPA